MAAAAAPAAVTRQPAKAAPARAARRRGRRWATCASSRAKDDAVRAVTAERSVATAVSSSSGSGGSSSGGGAGDKGPVGDTRRLAPAKTAAAARASVALERALEEGGHTEYGEVMSDVFAYFEARPYDVGTRVLRLSTIAARVYVCWTLGDERRGAVLRQGLQQLGPVFVKIGQTLSGRPDLVGEEAAEALAVLQDAMTPFPSDVARATLRDELGLSPGAPIAGAAGTGAPFRELAEEPIAAASLGQVYRGVTADGQDVAVKVQRPGVTYQIALDMHILREFLRWLQSYWKAETDMKLIADEVGSGLFRELDYRQEAANAALFAELHAFQPFVCVPLAVDSLSTRKVLTSQWIDGRKLAEIPSQDQATMIRMGVDCSAAQLMRTGVIHADPHEGNMLFTPDGRLALLDFGLISLVDDTKQEAIANSILHVLAENWRALIEDFRELELLEKPAIWVDDNGGATTGLGPGKWKEIPFPEYLEAFEKEMLAKTGGAGMSAFSDIVDALANLALKYRVALPPYLVLIIRSLTTLDGFAQRLDPPCNMYEAGFPHALRRALSPRTPSGREVLRKVLVDDNGRVQWERLLAMAVEAPATQEVVVAGRGADAADAPAVALSNYDTDTAEASLDAASGWAGDLGAELLSAREGKALRRIIYDANSASLADTVLAPPNELLVALFRTRPQQVVQRAMEGMCRAVLCALGLRRRDGAGANTKGGSASVHEAGNAQADASGGSGGSSEVQYDEQGRQIYQLGGNPRIRPYWVKRVARVLLWGHLRRLMSTPAGAVRLLRLGLLGARLVLSSVCDALVAPLAVVVRRARQRGAAQAQQAIGAEPQLAAVAA